MHDRAAQDAVLTSLAHLTARLSEARAPGDLLAAVADGARGLLPFNACALALRGSSGWQVWRVAAARPEDVSLNASIPQEAVETLERFLVHRQVLRINDLLVPPWTDASHRDVLWKDGTRSALLAPLRAADQVVGALSFTSSQPDRYPPSQRDVLTILTWMVSTALYTLPPTRTKPDETPSPS